MRESASSQESTQENTGESASRIKPVSGVEPPAAPSVDSSVQLRVSPFGGTASQLDQLMPVVLFLVFYNLVNTELAVVASTGWSVKAAYSRYRKGLSIGVWLPGITVYLMIRAAVSIAVERELIDFGVSSEAVYFGIGIASKVLIGLLAVGSILVGRPFMVWAIDKMISMPDSLRSHPVFISTLRNITWVVVFYELVSSIWDIWLFNNSGINLFVIGRQAVSLVVTFVLIFGAFLYLDKKLSKLPDWPGIANLVSPQHRDR